MAVVPRTNFSLATIAPDNSRRVVGIRAGAAIAAGQAVGLRSDGLLYPALNTDVFVGIAMTDASVGEPVTAMHGVTVRMDHGLASAALVYQSTTAGAFDSAVPGAGNTAPIGLALPDNRLMVFAK